MTEQTIQLPAARHFTTATRREWLFLLTSTDPQINSALAPEGAMRFLANLRLFRASAAPDATRVVALHLESTASETVLSTGEDLSAAFEARGSLEVAVSTGEQLTCLQRLSGDTQEQYTYTPGQGFTVEEFDAVFGALGGTNQSKAGTLIIRDYEPGAGGMAYGGRKISGAAYGGRKLSGGAFRGRKFTF